MRQFLAAVMPFPARFRRLLGVARFFRPIAGLLPKQLAAALALVPARSHDEAFVSPIDTPEARPRARVGLMTGCVQSVIGVSAHAATSRLLRRMGCELVELSGCCGSLTHHLGRTSETREFAAKFDD